MKSPQLFLGSPCIFVLIGTHMILNLKLLLATFPVFGHFAIQNFVHGFADSLCIVCRYPESQITSVELHLMRWASLSPEL